MEKADIVIIGAGVVGLAIAQRLSNSGKDIFVIEKECSFGQGISSRNSEVIHAGIYYPSNSLKAKTCVEGSRMLYEICAKNKIPFKKLGKLIVAINDKEVKQVDALFKQGKQNGVPGLEVIDASRIKVLEHNIGGMCALYSPETGIIDSHKLMEFLYSKAKEGGVSFVFHSEVKAIEKKNKLYEITIQDNQEDKFTFASEIVINSAGLNSDTIAQMFGLDINRLKYNLEYCKGQYFRLTAAKSKLVERLIYPVPVQSDGGLGIHLTPDISGQVKLGPDAKYLKTRQEDYQVDQSSQAEFYDSVKSFAPFIEKKDIFPDMSGIRPKLQGANEGFRDFIIKEESDNGFSRFVNLIGIESPGLTSAISIAKYVENILRQLN